MPSSKDKVRIRENTKTIAAMLKTREEMIKAFQFAFRALQERIDSHERVFRLLGETHPEILEQLQIQSENTKPDENSGGDGRSKILSVANSGVSTRIVRDILKGGL